MKSALAAIGLALLLLLGTSTVTDAQTGAQPTATASPEPLPPAELVGILLVQEGRYLNFFPVLASGVWRPPFFDRQAPSPAPEAPVVPGPNGDQLLYVSGGDIYHLSFRYEVVDETSLRIGVGIDFTLSDTTNLTPNTLDSLEFDPAWSPDGSRIVFASNRDQPAAYASDLYLMDVDGSHITRLTEHGASNTEPAWSPDGSHLVYVHEEGVPCTQLCLIEEGETVGQCQGCGWREPQWSPDGTQVLFRALNDDQREYGLFVMDVEQGDVREINTDIRPFQVREATPESIAFVNVKQPEWSPDGQAILFSASWLRIGNAPELVYSVDLRDGTLTQHSTLRDFNHVQTLPHWSPDGRWIAFLGYNQEAGTRVVVVGAAQSDRLLITPDGTSAVMSPRSAYFWMPIPED